jgi:UDP:flavonoid glycosyltransferase YjiC (YdhE family)
MNSVSEALYYGVPLIVIPQAGDQTWVARRVAQLGAGKLLHRSKIQAHALRHLADEIISNSSFKRASANIGESLRQAGGYVCAADEIEQFMLVQSSKPLK